MSARHLASFALIGVTGRRVGTRFIFKHEDIPGAIKQPHFRWRNGECRASYLSAVKSNINKLLGYDEYGICEDCPPVGYSTDKTRCLRCPRRTIPLSRGESR